MKLGVLMVFGILSLPAFGQNSQTSNLTLDESVQARETGNPSSERISQIRKDLISNSNREGGCGSQAPDNFREQAVMNNPKVIDKKSENAPTASPK